ncbi:phage late control D family protein [Solimonas soli]|uniref:phage late control D family protein n=1 Tax=Solimonas soli TaxID=413479 RepID=UPI00047F70AE|nr:contractile injection system protein, VgrG/Pvc8 family [Solimonas soli]
MADGATVPISGARPAIFIDGNDEARLSGALLGLDITETEAGLYRCAAQFGNWGGAERSGFQHFGRDRLEFGKTLAIKLGDDTLFEGRIGALRASFPEGAPPQIGVLVEDRLQDLRMTRRTRSFASSSIADVVRAVGNDHGLQPDVTLDGPTYPLLAQLNQSDLAFLRELLRRIDGQIWIEAGKLKARGATQRGGELELNWAGHLRSFEVSADLAQQCTALVASGWDVGAKRLAQYRAERSAISADSDGGQSGMEILEAAFGARVETLAHAAPGDAAQAQAQAQSALRLRARRFVVGRGVAETSAQLRVGARLKISGIGPLFEGRYGVTRVTHRFDLQKGLRSEFECNRADIGRAGASA